MGGYNWNQMYDVAGAAAGLNVAMTPEERQMQKLTNMIKAAESTNYDGDPEYYQQIKTMAMQAGIPIKEFKTNAFRMAKAGLLSFADMALLGMVPNDWYTPLNAEEEMMSGIGSIAGLINPYGGAGALARGAMGGLKAMPRWARGLANKGLGHSRYRKAANAYSGPMGWMGKRGGQFMGGGGAAAAGAPVVEAELVNAAPLALGRGGKTTKQLIELAKGGKKPLQLPAPKPKLLPQSTSKQLGLPKGKYNSKQLAANYNKKIANKKGAKMITPSQIKNGRGPIVPPNSKKLGIPAETNAKTLKAMKGKGTGKITVKSTGSGKMVSFNKLEERRIAAMMAPKVRARYMRLNRAKKTTFAKTWALKNPDKISFS